MLKISKTYNRDGRQSSKLEGITDLRMGQICGKSKKEKAPLDFDIGIEVNQSKNVGEDFDNRRSTLIIDEVQTDKLNYKRPTSTCLTVFESSKEETEKDGQYNNDCKTGNTTPFDTPNNFLNNLQDDSKQNKIQQDSLFNDLAIRDESPSTSKENQGDGIEINEKTERNEKDGNKSEECEPSLLMSILSPKDKNVIKETDHTSSANEDRSTKEEGHALKLESNIEPEKYTTPLSDTNLTPAVCTASISSGDIHNKDSALVIIKENEGDNISREIIGSRQTQETENLYHLGGADIGKSDKPSNITADEVIRISDNPNDLNGNAQDKSKSSVIAAKELSNSSPDIDSPSAPCKVKDDSLHATHVKSIDVHTNALLQTNERVQNVILSKNMEENETSEFKETSVAEKSLPTTTSESRQNEADNFIGSGGFKEYSSATEIKPIQATNGNIYTSRNEKDIVQKEGENDVSQVASLSLEQLNKDSENDGNSVDAGNSTQVKSKIPVFVGKTRTKDNGENEEPDSGQDKKTAKPEISKVSPRKIESKIDSNGEREKKDEVFPDVMYKRESSITIASTYGISEIVSATKAAKKLKARRQASKQASKIPTSNTQQATTQASKQEHKESILI